MIYSEVCILNAGASSMNPQQLDVFREIGNIGAGNAATALSILLDRPIGMNLPVVKLIPFTDIPGMVGGPEKLVVGGLIDIAGDLNGFVLLILEPLQAQKIVSFLCDKPPLAQEKLDLDSFTEMDKSALSEITNILSGACLSAISTFTGLNIVPSIPSVCIDMVGAFLSIIAIEYGMYSEYALSFETNFSDSSDNTLGNLFILPDQESYDKLLKSLGVPQ